MGGQDLLGDDNSIIFVCGNNSLIGYGEIEIFVVL